MTQEQIKTKYSVQGTFLVIFFLFIAVSTVLLNTFPVISSRDVVISSKQRALMNQTNVMSASLSGLERLSVEGVKQVMDLIDTGEYHRVIVSDRNGAVLYDTEDPRQSGNSVLSIPQLRRALAGESVFTCVYDGETFRSESTAPVMSYGNVIGGVYVSDDDTDQAALIRSIQARLRTASIVTGGLSLVVIVWFTARLTRRLRELAKAMRTVREGDYSGRVPVRGQDEVAELSAVFNEMNGRLQSTEELRRRFVSDASHELRTPLASIRLLSDSVVQSEEMDPETMREFVTDIGTEAERLQRLTEKLMRLTRMDSGSADERVPLDPAPVAQRCAHLLTPLAQEKRVTITTESTKGLLVKAAEDDLFQIIFNLTENAIKYNVTDGRVLLRLYADGSRAVLSVEDTGIGIPEADVEHVFERFYRVDKARSREFGGSGLGLSIVHDAVLSNGGEISVEPVKPQGTRFTVSFPQAEETNSEFEKGDPHVRPASSTSDI